MRWPRTTSFHRLFFFRRTMQRGAGADADVLAGATGYAPVRSYGHGVTNQQCPFGNRQRLTAMAGPFRRVRRRLRGKGAGRCNSEGRLPTPYCRALMDAPCCAHSVARVSWLQEFKCTPWGSHLTLADAVMSRGETGAGPGIPANSPVPVSIPTSWWTTRRRSATRVPPSFLRVGQLELFARRARQRRRHPGALNELQYDHESLIERNYRRKIESGPGVQSDQLVELGDLFRARLTSAGGQLELRVGLLQGNFNSDHCAAGGLHPRPTAPSASATVEPQDFSPGTGSAASIFSFFNQPVAGRSQLSDVLAPSRLACSMATRSPARLGSDPTMASLKR